MKHLVWILCFCLLFFSACGQKSDTEPGIEASASPEELITEEEVPPVTIEETRIWEQDGLIITARSLQADPANGPKLNLLIQNNTAKDLAISCAQLAVNNFMLEEDDFSCTLLPGEKSGATLTLHQNQLDALGIEKPAEIVLSFRVNDSAAEQLLYFTDPYTLQTSVGEGYEQAYDTEGTVLMHKNRVKIILQGTFKEDRRFGPELKLYIENGSDRNIVIQMRDTTVLGLPMDPVFSAAVGAKRQAVSYATFFYSDFEAVDIDTFKDIAFRFEVNELETLGRWFMSDPIVIEE